jgi:hypothetical protein
MAAAMAAGCSKGWSSRSVADDPDGIGAPRNHPARDGLRGSERISASPMSPTVSPDSCDNMSEVVADASMIERADVEVTKAVAPYRNALPVRVMGQVSELADQPPLISICTATMALGLISGNRRIARSGARMLASELLATAIKSAVKKSIDRTRPKVLVDEGHYRMEPGTTQEHLQTSFPSGHTAGAAYVAAGAAALVQIPRCTHYPSDLAAGAAIGLVAELAVSAVLDRLLPPEVQDTLTQTAEARLTSA